MYLAACSKLNRKDLLKTDLAISLNAQSCRWSIIHFESNIFEIYDFSEVHKSTAKKYTFFRIFYYFAGNRLGLIIKVYPLNVIQWKNKNLSKLRN